jgi:hypothetical protein
MFRKPAPARKPWENDGLETLSAVGAAHASGVKPESPYTHR